jgi:hypothetical protein
VPKQRLIIKALARGFLHTARGLRRGRSVADLPLGSRTEYRAAESFRRVGRGPTTRWPFEIKEVRVPPKLTRNFDPIPKCPAEIFARDQVHASLTGTPAAQCGATAMLSNVLTCQNRWDEALQVCEEALEKFRLLRGEREQTGSLTLLTSRALLLHRRGRREEALRLSAYCVDHYQASGNDLGAVGMVRCMATVEYKAGKKKNGLTLLDQAITMAREKVPGVLAQLTEQRKVFV